MTSKGLFEQICSIENLFSSFAKFSTGKHSKADVMSFEHFLEDNLFAIQAELLSGSYKHSAYEALTILDPKKRQIHKAIVKDRVVHQAVVSIVEPLFERHFIHDSYSCRIGKGTHAAVDRLRHFLVQASRNNTRIIYALKCDVKKFFASVDHDILMKLLKRRILDEPAVRLLENIVKSFSISEGRGIPLGNLTSQLFANVYLHELDRYVKLTLREKFYLRYCDDFIILSGNRDDLLELAEKINVFLDQALALKLHPKKLFVRTWTQGIDFLGYVLLPHATVVRTKTVKRMLMRVNEDNLTSYMGVCIHADSFDLRRIILTKVIGSGNALGRYLSKRNCLIQQKNRVKNRTLEAEKLKKL